MRKYVSASKLLSAFFVLLLGAISINPGFAQEPSSWSQMMIVQVHPGMGFEFEEFLKTELFPAMRKGGAAEWSGWRNSFGESGQYVFSTPLASLAQLDQPGPLIKALGLEGMKAIMERMHKYVVKAHSYVQVGRSDLAIEPPAGYVPRLGLQVRTTVVPGRNQDYEKWTKGIVNVIKNTNAKGIYAGKMLMGCNPNEYHTVVLFDSYGDIEKFGPAFSKGMEEANIPSATGVVAKMEYRIYEYVPELSQVPSQ